MPRLTAFVALMIVTSVAGCATARPAEQMRLISFTDVHEPNPEEDADCRSSLPVRQEEAPLFASNGLCSYSLYYLADESAQDLVMAGKGGTHSHPAIHGPYSISMLLDFIAPSKDKLDEAYGLDGRFLIRAFDKIYLGGAIGYARMKHESREGLIKGELQRYTALFWCEYRFSLGETTWSPSVDVAIGPGWFFAEAVPLSAERQAIESSGSKLQTQMMSNSILRLAVQLRLPVLRSTDISISEGNADVVIGIGTEFGEGKARYTITDYATVTKTVSKGAVALDAFHVFIGLSFRF